MLSVNLFHSTIRLCLAPVCSSKVFGSMCTINHHWSGICSSPQLCSGSGAGHQHSCILYWTTMTVFNSTVPKLGNARWLCEGFAGVSVSCWKSRALRYLLVRLGMLFNLSKLRFPESLLSFTPNSLAPHMHPFVYTTANWKPTPIQAALTLHRRKQSHSMRKMCTQNRGS